MLSNSHSNNSSTVLPGDRQMEKIVGYDWEAIQRAQQGGRLSRSINLAVRGDYGADPVGDGTYRMVPSGEVVDLAERDRRLAS